MTSSCRVESRLCNAIGESFVRLVLSFYLALIACVAFAATDDEQAARTKRIYESYCYVCHGTGWQGAPLTGNPGDWQPRIGQGWDTVLKNTRLGLNGMPPKGTCEECSDADFRAVIERMVKEQ